MRRALGAAAAGALVLVMAPAAQAAGCKAGTTFKAKGGDLHAAEYLEWPPGKRGKLTVGEPIEAGTKLEDFTGYWVPAGAKVVMKGGVAGTTSFTAGPRTYFVPQCDGGQWQVRLMMGSVTVSGPRFGGSKPRSFMNSPEAAYMPLPGRPRYTVTRHVGSSKAKSYATLTAARGGSAVWARLGGGMLNAGKQIPCQIGKRLTIYDTGRYRAG